MVNLPLREFLEELNSVSASTYEQGKTITAYNGFIALARTYRFYMLHHNQISYQEHLSYPIFVDFLTFLINLAKFCEPKFDKKNKTSQLINLKEAGKVLEKKLSKFYKKYSSLTSDMEDHCRNDERLSQLNNPDYVTQNLDKTTVVDGILLDKLFHLYEDWQRYYYLLALIHKIKNIDFRKIYPSKFFAIEISNYLSHIVTEDTQNPKNLIKIGEGHLIRASLDLNKRAISELIKHKRQIFSNMESNFKVIRLKESQQIGSATSDKESLINDYRNFNEDIINVLVGMYANTN